MPETNAAQDWIDLLGLSRHPEGGWYREVYRAREGVAQAALPARFGGDRSFSTAIYYLLEAGQSSALHRIAADELWHFYEGQPLGVEVIHPDGRHETLLAGRNAAGGERPLAVVPAGCWFGASVQSAEGYSLVGCTVAPGFDFADFEMGDRGELLQLFPQHRELIQRLSR